MYKRVYKYIINTIIHREKVTSRRRCIYIYIYTYFGTFRNVESGNEIKKKKRNNNKIKNLHPIPVYTLERHLEYPVCFSAIPAYNHIVPTRARHLTDVTSYQLPGIRSVYRRGGGVI